jgi:hypothetical protein
MLSALKKNPVDEDREVDAIAVADAVIDVVDEDAPGSRGLRGGIYITALKLIRQLTNVC